MNIKSEYKNKKTIKGGGVFLNILFIFALIFGVVAIFQQKTVCEKPLEYSLGKIDSNFNIPEKEFLNLVTNAETIWEEGTGIDLFTYSEDAPFKINLVFDERQRETIAEKRFKESLNKNNTVYDELVKKNNTLKSLYNKRFDEFESEVELYEKQLQAYNRKVTYYNKNGGAPEKKYDELKNEKANLKLKITQLNQARAKLDSLGDETGLSVKKLNSFVSSFNSDVNRYNKSFGTSKIFDQGEYTGTEINIYQFDGMGDLRVVLAHEFGHALNLDHVENNPKSIMYYLMEKQNPENPELSKEDIAALNVECGL